MNLKTALRFDDSLDVVGVHMFGGIVGALLTGAFASLVINPAGADGSIEQVGKQAVAVLVTLSFTFVASYALLKLTDVTVGLRVTEDEEELGLDLAEHGEVGYTPSPRGRLIPPVAAGERDAEPVAAPGQLIDPMLGPTG